MNASIALAARGLRLCVGAALWLASSAIFAMTAAGSAPLETRPVAGFHTLHTFPTGQEFTTHAPFGGVVRADDGNFYGTTLWGGEHGQGTIFRMSPRGAVTELHAFNGSDGQYPRTSLIQGRDGLLYGAAHGNGNLVAFNHGAVFKMTLDGQFTLLHAFSGHDGSGPQGLMEAADGFFYGTTEGGGSGHAGTAFRISAAGQFEQLHSFECNRDGGDLRSVPVQARDGNFYGVTYQCGRQGMGTVYRMTPQGEVTALHHFDCVARPDDGCMPEAGLTLGRDGELYGSTTQGGKYNPGQHVGAGAIFRITIAGKITLLHSFALGEEAGCVPASKLVQAQDGTFYGTTYYGGHARGENGSGTVFAMSPQGGIAVLHRFGGGDDGHTRATLARAPNGLLYGTTPFGGRFSGGTVYLVGEKSLLPASTTGAGER